MNANQHSNVWITGASSGLGEALAREYASHGHRVMLSARSVDKLQEVASSIGGAAIVYPLDVTDDQQLHRTVSDIETEHGQIDIAILNAGTYWQTPLKGITVSNVRDLFAVNFFSIVAGIEYLAPRFVARGSGHIVVVASVAGDIGLPYSSAYSASKSALNRLCESLAPELRQYGVDMSVVNPGFVETPLTSKNEFPMPFIIKADRAAEIIYRDVLRGRFEIRFPWTMSIAMRLLSRMPRSLSLYVTRRMLKS